MCYCNVEAKIRNSGFAGCYTFSAKYIKNLFSSSKIIRHVFEMEKFSYSQLVGWRIK